MKLPTSIDPCPIVDTVLELRYETDVPSNAIFGILYSHFKSDYPNFENLSISQLPLSILDSDPNFKYAARHRIFNEKFTLNIGPNSLLIAPVLPYPGWNLFFDEIRKILSQFFSLKICKSPTRMGLRYINYFPEPVFPNLEIEVKTPGFDIEENNIYSLISTPPFKINLNLVSKGIIDIQGSQKVGSLIDIDVFLENHLALNTFQANYESILIDSHEKEKIVFYSLLKKEFLATLNPVY